MEPAVRVAVVTGGNKGIGFAITRILCKEFAGRVYLTARDEGRGRTAVETLEKGMHAHFHQLDIDEQESINRFALYLKEKYGGLDCLVNNAAIAFPIHATENFGYQAEKTISTNFYGTLNVCNALFPLLRPHARVVNVSSCAGFLQRIPGESLRKELSSPDLTTEKLCELMDSFVKTAKSSTHAEHGWPDSAYVVSKVGVSALTRIQQAAFNKDPRPDIIVNHVHPGYVDTDMTSHKGHLTIEQGREVQPFWKVLQAGNFAGAEAPVYVALLPENVSSPKGDYLWHDKQIIDWVNGPLPAPY